VTPKSFDESKSYGGSNAGDHHSYVFIPTESEEEDGEDDDMSSLLMMKRLL
jgi:hypothetical protein